LQTEIRSLSSTSAPDIDGWIAQAAALETSLARSRDTARSIVEEAAAGRALLAHVEDAAAKVALLERELKLSETLEGALDTLQVIVGLIESSNNALGEDEISGALDKLLQAEKVLTGLRRDGRGVRDCRAVGLLEKRISAVRGSIVDEVLEYWRELVTPNAVQKSITVSQQKDNVPMSLDSVVNSMSTLGLLDTGVTRLHRDIDSLIISPRLSRSQKAGHHRVQSTPTEIHLSANTGAGTTLEMIEDVYKIVDFISSAFPFALTNQLLNSILPSLILQLVSDWLDPSLPLKLENLTLFQEITGKVEELAQFVSKIEVDIPSDASLSNWLKKIPQTWLARRKETSLLEMRAMCYKAVKSKKIVERVETQIVQVDDVMYTGQGEDDNEQEDAGDWDESWGNEEEPDEDGQQGEEDTSAWDVEDAEPPKSHTDENEDEEAEAWGWGDEGNTTSPTQPAVPVPKSPVKRKPNGKAKTIQPTTKEVTLRESYMVTGIPNGILELITQILADAEKLSSPDFAVPTIKPATMGLATIPTLLLAMYRATASTYYSSDLAGQMLVYNDTVHLNGELKELISTVSPEHPLSKRLRSLETDIASLGQFSRRAYGREMDSQRTILSDILSSTSGFVNSTAPLNAKQYTATVQDAVNRVRDVNRVWQGVLSDSARLQSLGSLTGTLVKQIVSDILERADDPIGISEEQSKALKGFCDKIAELSDLFEEPGASDTTLEKPSLVHVYTPNWFRFKYLGEILDASLADIKYLWMEGELKLEFRVDEVVELIQALFADSSYRRDAIRDIRKSS
jgi:centromere/kinetochore protein ZW10